MTDNQTIDGVPRELLERAVQAILNTSQMHPALEELRALLDSDKCTSCDGSGEYIDAIGDWRGYCTCAAGVALQNKPVIQPQGEPVAYRYKEAHAAWENEKPWEPTTLAHGAVLLERKELAANGIFRANELEYYSALTVEPLYAEQTAPVALNSQAMTELRHIFDSNKGADGTLVISKKLAAQILNPSL